jgi:hypothetical protein
MWSCESDRRVKTPDIPPFVMKGNRKCARKKLQNLIMIHQLTFLKMHLGNGLNVLMEIYAFPVAHLDCSAVLFTHLIPMRKREEI